MNRTTITTAGKVKIDTTVLDRLKSELAKSENMRVKVGILGQTTDRADAGTLHNPHGLTNAEIGLKNEFGSKAENVPERSFLRVPLLLQLPKELKRIPRDEWIKAITEHGMEYALKQLGVLAEGVVLTGFSTRGYGRWAPNAPLTVMIKGSDQPLIDHGELRHSITSAVEKGRP